MNCFLGFELLDVIDALQRSQLAPLGNAVGWLVLWLLPVFGLCYAIYYFLSLPIRRRERARIVLDLIETALRRGQSLEQTIVSAAGSNDPVLGVRFQMLAAHIENGLSLEEALEAVPRLLPPEIAATLKVGLELGDLPRVLPACRKQLKDCVSQAQGALNFVLVMVFMILPIFPLLFVTIMVWVMPRFQEIYKDMLPGTALPGAWLLELGYRLVFVHVGLVILLQALVLCYVGGPRLKGWLRDSLAPLTDGLAWRLPWRRKRLQRNFSNMLALLLDAGLPETRAVQLAAASTANRVLEWRAETVTEALADGVPLTDAVGKLDDSGEFRWRLGNAARSRNGFLAALSGWIESLDAKAFQQEQAAAQLLTTGLVLFNGLLVGILAVTIFLILTTLIREGALW
jgi:type IV pilus assembly protein PilC